MLVKGATDRYQLALMMEADILLCNGHQAIRHHQTDQTVIITSFKSYYTTYVWWYSNTSMLCANILNQFYNINVFKWNFVNFESKVEFHRDILHGNSNQTPLNI